MTKPSPDRMAELVELAGATARLNPDGSISMTKHAYNALLDRAGWNHSPAGGLDARDRVDVLASTLETIAAGILRRQRRGRTDEETERLLDREPDA